MDKENYFLLSVILIFCSCLFVLGIIIQEDLVKNLSLNNCFEKTFLIVLALITVGLFIGAFAAIFKREETKVVYIDEREIVSGKAEYKKCEKLILGAEVEQVKFSLFESIKELELNSKKIILADSALASCTKLETIVLYGKSERMDSNFASGCSSLKEIIFYGDLNEWRKFKINVPDSVVLEFVPVKTKVFSQKNGEKKNLGIDVNINFKSVN